jgi:hypothetical protein
VAHRTRCCSARGRELQIPVHVKLDSLGQKKSSSRKINVLDECKKNGFVFFISNVTCHKVYALLEAPT